MTSLKVKKTGLNIDDEVVASLMLADLPDEFIPLVMAVENSETKLTIDAVKTLLLQETRLKPGEGSAFFYEKSQEVSMSHLRQNRTFLKLMSREGWKCKISVLVQQITGNLMGKYSELVVFYITRNFHLVAILQ